MLSDFLATPILTALRIHPDGMTAKEVAAELSWKNTKASALMGRMFFSGALSRRGALSGPARQNNEYIYTIKPPVPAPALRPIADVIRIAVLASEADRLADLETM